MGSPKHFQEKKLPNQIEPATSSQPASPVASLQEEEFECEAAKRVMVTGVLTAQPAFHLPQLGPPLGTKNTRMNFSSPYSHILSRYR